MKLGLATFYGVAICHGPSPLFRLNPLLFILLSLNLSYPQIMPVHRSTQHYLCVLLADDKLIQMLFQHARGCATDAGGRDISQGPSGRLIWVVEARETLAAEVRAAVLRLLRAS